jgi:archaeal flagellin FlaB
MRANRKMRDERKDQAQVGIGTMIVFIATVLVAAIAAGVLIDTSGKLQERSATTGDQATKQVASNLRVERVVGERWSGSADIKIGNVTFYLSLAPGAQSVDLKQLKVAFSDGNNLKTVGWNSHNNSANHNGFHIASVRDADSSITLSGDSEASANNKVAVMTPGDVVRVKLNLAPASVDSWNFRGLAMELSARTQVYVTLSPEIGAPIKADFTTPESFGKARQIELR